MVIKSHRLLALATFLIILILIDQALRTGNAAIFGEGTYIISIPIIAICLLFAFSGETEGTSRDEDEEYDEDEEE